MEKYIQKIPVYVIGLIDYPERWQPTIARLHKMGIKAELWEAVDGTRKTPELRPNESFPSRFERWLNPYTALSNPEIACYLSHFRLLQYAWENGAERIVIFEERIVPEPELPEVLQAIEKMDSQNRLDDSFDLIHTGFNREAIDYSILPSQKGTQLTRKYQLLSAKKYHTQLIGSYGLIIHRRAIAKLIRRLMPLRFGYDIQLTEYSGIPFKVLKPWVTDLVKDGSVIAPIELDLKDTHTYARKGKSLRYRLFIGLMLYRHLFIWMQKISWKQHLRHIFHYLTTLRFPLPKNRIPSS